MQKDFVHREVFEELLPDPSLTTRSMFGCLALYYKGLNVAVLAQDPGEKMYRGKQYSFDIWDGVLWPTSHEHHSSLRHEFPFLVAHPVLGKWLYLPQQMENFEECLLQMIKCIRRGDPRLGVLPKPRAKTRKIISRPSKSPNKKSKQEVETRSRSSKSKVELKKDKIEPPKAKSNIQR